MSIINEALKKTEESIQKNSIQGTDGGNKKPGRKPYLFYLLIFIVGLFLSSLIFSLIKSKVEKPALAEPPVKTASISEKQIQIGQPLSAIKPEEQEKPEKKFILNGIFLSDNKGYAIINSQIAKEGDSIEGVKVEKITENTVELNNEGKTISLSIGR
ncbi:MAG: hypothetical protein PHO40_04990 [Candidatus Omnitrophica bacterium]|jgi:type II secretory pathway component PulC|nr:hypothetical protein [Candidatus Omnitrophota bacterium]